MDVLLFSPVKRLMSEEHDVAETRDAPQPDAAESRDARLMQISDSLRKENWVKQCNSLRQIQALLVSVDEAHQHGIGGLVLRLHLAQPGRASLKIMAKNIIERWIEEKPVKRRKVMEEPDMA